MAEYIEREKAIDATYALHFKDLIQEALRNLPAADVKPVVRGKWVDEKGNPVPWDKFHRNCPASGAYGVNCSVCGEWLSASDEYSVVGNFCPNCGADMKEKR